MSSILKALRKIEEEKRVASHSAPDLRLDQGNSARKGRPFLPLVAGIVLGAVCVGLVSLWSSSETPTVVTLPMQQPIAVGVENKQADPLPLMTEENKVAAPVVSPVASLAVPVQEQTAAPAVEVVEIPEVIMPVETVPVLSEMTVISEQSEPPKQQPGIVSERKSSPEVIAPKIVATTATEAPKAELTETRAPTLDAVAVIPATLPEGVHLKVSETFYPEDPANSMAVVNDLPVMIGTFVDSAMVLEIHPNKVVFRIDDDSYDVPVTANQQP